MNYNVLILAVIICFTCIHIIEVLSFMARIAGVKENKKSLAYSLQNAIFMLTRFFMMALLPVLGLLIDKGVSKGTYIFMVFCALLGASFFSFIVFLLRDKVIGAFSIIINNIAKGRSIFKEIILFPYYFFKPIESSQRLKHKVVINTSIFISSSIVFCIYSLSVFMVFFIALFFPEYRTMISQLSGVTNAFATVLLTFIIEPNISRSIDLNENTEQSENLLLSLVLGRIFGVGVISQLIIFGCFYVIF
ncbi:DUF2837 family protein [Acinetobacter haemolyticus]|uniref:lipid II flippase family protein n=1 Tax=Acinetobacter haemolyticus TaxID=29430 RepID=UPI0013724F9E|nr:DUF2837 family protein [Acinetobacter haemolyticus]NAR82143.1 DUF2837 family protein [Acinetobacter haemolyticus]